MDFGQRYDIDQLRELGGIIDYTVGPAGVKAFVLAEHADPKQRHYLNLYKMGEGPLYPFWVPYHLVHFETPFSIARVVDSRRQPRSAAGRPVGRGVRRRQARPAGGRGARRLRHVHDLRRGVQCRGDERWPLPARGARRGLPAQARHRPGRGVDLRRRRAAGRSRSPTRLRAEQYRHFRGETWLEDFLRDKGDPVPLP